MTSTPLVSTIRDSNRNLPTTSSIQALYTEPSLNELVPMFLTHEEALILKYFLAVLAFIFSPAGVVTNIVNIYAFLRIGLRESVTVSTLFLSYSDLFGSFGKLVVLLASVVTLVEDNTRVYFFPVDPSIVMIVGRSVVVLYFLTTSLITTYLALTRCMCVIRPLRFKAVFTVRRTVVVLFVAAVLPILINVPVCLEYRTSVIFNPSNNVSRPILWVTGRWADINQLISLTTLFFIPITCQVIVVISVILIIAGLKSSSSFRKSGIATETDERSRKDTELQGKELRVAYQVILISVTFLVTNMAAIITTTLFFAIEELPSSKKYEYIYEIATEFLSIPLMLNCCSTLIIYLKFNSAFRKVLSRKKQ